MIEFGKTLRLARESKGFTTSQIADKTHMLVQVVEGLEREDFSRIVAPIYGRGFVKLYCEAVGLDAKPLVDAFMEIYSGNRAPAPAAQPATPPPPPPPEPTVHDTEPPKANPFARLEPTDTAAAPTAPAPAAQSGELDFGTAPKTASRYAAPVPIDDEPRFSLPQINWRLVILALGAIGLVALMLFGFRALYRATMSAPDEGESPVAQEREEPKPAEEVKPTEEVKPAGTQPAAPRTPLSVKPLYIDSDHSTERKAK